MDRPIQSFWNPLPAGLALGALLLLAFLLTGHGINVTSVVAHLGAWAAGTVAPEAAQWNAYLGPLLAQPIPLAYWPAWEVAGLALGGWVSSLSANRFRARVDGVAGAPADSQFGARLVWAFAGGVLAGFGARIARGCTSSIGLSGSATLAVAGFVFLAGFFAAGLAASRLLRRVRK